MLRTIFFALTPLWIIKKICKLPKVNEFWWYYDNDPFYKRNPRNRVQVIDVKENYVLHRFSSPLRVFLEMYRFDNSID